MNHLSQSAINDDRKGSYFLMLMPHLLTTAITKSSHPKNTNCRSFKFYMYKGLQIFNQTRDLVQVLFDEQGNGKIEKVELSFFVRDYLLLRNNKFLLKLYEISPEREEVLVGTLDVVVTQYMQEFSKKGKTGFRQVSKIGPYELDFHLFIHHDRYNLQRVVKIFRDEEVEQEHEAQDKIPGQKKASSFLSLSPTRLNDFQQGQSSPKRKKNTITIKIRNSFKEKQKSQVQAMFSYQEPEIPRSPQIGFIRLLASIKIFNQASNDSLKPNLEKDFSENNIKKLQYNLKWLLFLVFSVFIIIAAMTPARKVPLKKFKRRSK